MRRCLWPLWFNSIRVSKSENCNWRSKFVVTNLSTAAPDKFTCDWLRINWFTGLSTRNKFRWVLSTTPSRFCEFDRRFSRSSRPPSHGNWMDRSWHGSPVQVAQVVWLCEQTLRPCGLKLSSPRCVSFLFTFIPWLKLALGSYPLLAI